MDTWGISENYYDKEALPLRETLYAQGNGYLGTRGTFEEREKESHHGVEGVYINGFYETQDIHYEESAYGFASESQTMLNLPNGKVIQLIVDGERFSLDSGEVLDYFRKMDFKTGTVKRKIHWRSPKGKEVLIEISRVISFSMKPIMAIQYAVKPLSGDFPIKLISSVDSNVKNLSKAEDPRVGSNLKGSAFIIDAMESGTDISYLALTTKRSRLKLCVAMKNEINVCDQELSYAEDGYLTDEFTVSGKKEEQVILNKYIAYYTGEGASDNGRITETKRLVREASSLGYEKIAEDQAAYMAEYWEQGDIQIEGADEIMQGLRFNLFHLLQGTGKDGKTSVSAKGLSGEGYEGHYFWESETYIMPVFLFSFPEIAKSILMYRYQALDQAREIAETMSHKGAMFPWRTINGYECSAYFLAGTAQYHITGGVSYAVKRYFEATQDEEFMVNYGAEILMETARFWLSAGHFNENKGGSFCIDCVTGPDEYTALVNNNCYTNVMASENMLSAHEIYTFLEENYPEQLKKLCKKINLKNDEPKIWKAAGERIYLPYDETLHIYKQDDTFLDKKMWDFENTPKENYPLLLHYHPIIIYRHQVSKQPDLLLIELLAKHRFESEQVKRDYEYYSQVITHDSSLSESIFSIVACMAGDYKKAEKYFMDTVRLDLDNTHNNTQDGLHMANMAGAWASVVNGFAGMSVEKGIMKFNPYIPKDWESYRFKLKFQNCLLEVFVAQDRTEFCLLEGESLEIYCNNESLIVQDKQIVLREGFEQSGI